MRVFSWLSLIVALLLFAARATNIGVGNLVYKVEQILHFGLADGLGLAQVLVDLERPRHESNVVLDRSRREEQARVFQNHRVNKALLALDNSSSKDLKGEKR